MTVGGLVAGGKELLKKGAKKTRKVLSQEGRMATFI